MKVKTLMNMLEDMGENREVVVVVELEEGGGEDIVPITSAQIIGENVVLGLGEEAEVDEV